MSVYSRIGKFLRLVAICAMSQCAFAGDDVLSSHFTIVTSYIPPYSIKYDRNANRIEGFGGEVLLESLKTAGLDKNVSVNWLPWRRAQATAQMEKNTIIFPLTRTAVREPQYKWVALLGTVQCAVFALDPKVKISTPDDLKQLRLGVLAGSPPETETLRILGKEMAGHLFPVDDERVNYKKLLLNRIDAWVTQDIVKNYAVKAVYEETNVPPPTLYKGFVLFEQPLWVAVNKETGDEDIAKLRKALEDFIRLPAYQRLLAKYGE